MRANADIAPIKTIIRGCLIAIIAAIKKVLSPNSDTTITDNDATNACKKLTSKLLLLLLLFIESAVLILSPLLMGGKCFCEF